MYALARGLQLLGLILVGMGLIHGVSEGGMGAMKLELILAGAGVAAFLAGWWLQRPRG